MILKYTYIVLVALMCSCTEIPTVEKHDYVCKPQKSLAEFWRLIKLGTKLVISAKNTKLPADSYPINERVKGRGWKNKSSADYYRLLIQGYKGPVLSNFAYDCSKLSDGNIRVFLKYARIENREFMDDVIIHCCGLKYHREWNRNDMELLKKSNIVIKYTYKDYGIIDEMILDANKITLMKRVKAIIYVNEHKC
jgi:hypothetical protein